MAKTKVTAKPASQQPPSPEELAHSPIGASSCERWWNCPGSVRLLRTLPDNMFRPTMYTAEGTLAHKLCEDVLKGKYKLVDLELKCVGETRMQDGFEVEITDEMIEAIRIYEFTVTQDAVEMGFYTGSGIRVEQQFVLADVDPYAFGTTDAIVGVDFGLLRVYDFKYGAGVAVEVEENKQLMYYALGAFQTATFEEIEIIIVQPRARHKDGAVRRWRMPASTLLAFRDELKKRVAATRNPNAPCVAGEWCNKSFCPARPVCSAVLNKTSELAQSKFTEIIDSRPASPDQMTREQILNVLKYAPMIHDWLKEVEGYALGLAESGEELPGFKLVPKRATRKWNKSETDVADELSLFVSDDVLYEKSLKSPAKMEKALKSAGVYKYADIVGAHTISLSSGLTLAPESDTRAAVRSIAELEFTEIETDE